MNEAQAIGLCECGCGQRTTLAKQSETKRGYVKGQPVRFIPGHSRRLEAKPVERYAVDETTGCWVWQWAINKRTGYGAFHSQPAHRVIWQEHHGPLPTGVHLHHVCENRLCVNPEHLEPVTAREHVRHHARLTPEQAAEIRATPKRYGSGRELARRFDVSEECICGIRNGRNWT